MIKAGALSYAIIFILLIGLICSGVIFIFGSQKTLQNNFKHDEQIILNSYFSLHYGINNEQKFDKENRLTYVHLNGDTSFIQKVNWGVFDLLITETKNKGRQNTKGALFLFDSSLPKYSFFVPGKENKLLVSGNVQIDGPVVSPNGIISSIYIPGSKENSLEILNKSDVYSETTFPKASDKILNKIKSILQQPNHVTSTINKDSTYTFLEKPTIFKSNTSINIQNNLGGNLIIYSSDSVFVSKNAILNDVIIISPVVYFESGFSGNLQVIANQSIQLEQNVTLKYPSFLVLLDTIDQTYQKKLTITTKEKCVVAGGIFAFSSKYNCVPEIIISEKNLIAGNIYNNGVTEIHGLLLGTLYSNKIQLKKAGGVYYDAISEIQIDPRKIPLKMATLNWMTEEQYKPKIIKWLNN